MVTLPVIQLFLIGWLLVSHCVQIFIAYFGAPYTNEFTWVLEVGITSDLGGPVGWLVGWVRFQEVITFKT